MRKIKVEQLTVEAFKDFGAYANLLEPSGPKIGAPPIDFYRDMLIQTFDITGSISYSICAIGPRPFYITETENHYCTGEAAMPMDGDVIMHFGLASKVPCYDNYRAFYVPKGTMVIIRPGVWHHAPYVLENKLVHMLAALPEMTYVKDCYVIELKKENRIEIENL
jgi:ureidoglycolate lyase